MRSRVRIIRTKTPKPKKWKRPTKLPGQGYNPFRKMMPQVLNKKGP